MGAGGPPDGLLVGRGDLDGLDGGDGEGEGGENGGVHPLRECRGIRKESGRKSKKKRWWLAGGGREEDQARLLHSSRPRSSPPIHSHVFRWSPFSPTAFHLEPRMCVNNRTSILLSDPNPQSSFSW